MNIDVVIPRKLPQSTKVLTHILNCQFNYKMYWKSITYLCATRLNLNLHIDLIINESISNRCNFHSKHRNSAHILVKNFEGFQYVKIIIFIKYILLKKAAREFKTKTICCEYFFKIVKKRFEDKKRKNWKREDKKLLKWKKNYGSKKNNLIKQNLRWKNY